MRREARSGALLTLLATSLAGLVGIVWHQRAFGAEPGPVLAGLSWQPVAPISDGLPTGARAAQAGAARAAGEAVQVAEAAARAAGAVRLPGLVRLAGGKHLYVVDVVLVPRHAHVALSALLPAGAFARFNEVFRVRWNMSEVSHESLQHPCQALPHIEMELASNVTIVSARCEILTPQDGNLGRDRIATVLYPLPRPALVALQQFSREAGPRASARLKLTPTGGAHALVHLASRSAGLFRHTTRSPADLADVKAFANPSGKSLARDDASLSVCLPLLVSYTPYIDELMQYYRRIGVAHVYLGVFGEGVAASVEQRLAWYGAAGLLSIVRMHDTPGVVMERAKPLFLYSCLHHAKQEDTFVGVWDIDEVPLVTDPRLQGRAQHLARYLYDLVQRGTMTAGPLEVTDKWNPPRANSSHPVPYFCQVLLQASVAVPANPGSILAASARSDSLGQDFPLRTIKTDYAKAPHYVKSIAVAATTNMVEIHKHSNCRFKDGRGQERAARRAPPERRLYPSNSSVIVLHFATMHAKVAGRYVTSRDVTPSEFTPLMADFRERSLKRL